MVPTKRAATVSRANPRAVRAQVCGGIAAGKTTLVRALTESFSTVYEPYEANPFWTLFYENPVEHAFETEVTFLLQHYSLLKQAGPRNSLFDFSLVQDLAYADINLAGGHHAAFSSVAEVAIEKVREPEVLVVVGCSVEEQLRRIHERGRPPEQAITAEYLENLNRAIERRVALLGDRTVIVRVDGEALDLVSDPGDRPAVRQRLQKAVERAQEARQAA